MGLVYADIELVSGDDLVLSRRGYLPKKQIKRSYTRSLIDSSATMLEIPDFVKTQLDLRQVNETETELADGSSRRLEVVGSVEVRFENRRTLVEALVVPDSTQLLLGAILMEGMDVPVDPKRGRLIVNQESPEVTKVLLV